MPRHSTSGKYAEMMVYMCKRFGMKPVCDDPAACKSDPASLYIGQTGKLTSAAGRSAKGGAPKGFEKYARRWEGKCGYSGKGKPAMCAAEKGKPTPAATADVTNPGFICGKRSDDTLSAFLGSRNGAMAGLYVFKRVVVRPANPSPSLPCLYQDHRMVYPSS